KVLSDIDVPAGKVVLKADFKKKAKDTKLPIMEQLGAGGTVTLSINGKAVGTMELAKTVPLQFSLAGDGLGGGFHGGTPGSSAYTGYFPFTGTIERVVIALGDDDLKAEFMRKDKTRD